MHLFLNRCKCNRWLAVNKTIAELELKIANETGVLLFVEVGRGFFTNKFVIVAMLKQNVHGFTRKREQQGRDPERG